MDRADHNEVEQLRRELAELRAKEQVFIAREEALADANVKAVLLLEEVEAKNAIIEQQRAELEQFSRALEARVEERTRELEDARAQLQHLVDQLRAQRDRLEQLANTDPLTELHNHRYFQERLDSELARAQRYHRSVSLLLIDLDRFKSVNDRLGHPAGDMLLQQISDVLKRSFRSIDIVARYGGDEFAVILPEVGATDAAASAERVRAEIGGMEFSVLTDGSVKHKIAATITIGVSCFPDHSSERDGLIMAADIAMYSGKYLSRNRVNVYTPSQQGDHAMDPNEMYRLLHEPSVSALTTLAAAVDARDNATAGHSERVTRYALEIAQQMGLSQEHIDQARVAGLLHDVGKLGIPDKLLFKPASLTTKEREAIQQHTEMGKAILDRIPQMETIVPVILHHHERWDGSGYPRGIQGRDIPLLARILAVADAYDAMTSDRPYRKAMPHHEAISELLQCAGKQFDPEVVQAFVLSFEEQAGQSAAA